MDSVVRDRVIQTIKERLHREPKREEVIEVMHRVDQLREEYIPIAIETAMEELQPWLSNRE